MRLLVLLLAVLRLWAADKITVYSLLAPATHSFDIIYDVTATREGAAYFSFITASSNSRSIDFSPLALPV